MYDPSPTNNPPPAAPQRPADSSFSVPAPLTLAVLTASYISGGGNAEQDKAVREEGAYLRSLAGGSSSQAVQSLAAQLPVLEALFLRLAKEAVEATRSTEKVKLLKASLQAQESYGRTVALIAKLNKQEGDWDTVDEVSWR